MTPRIAVICCPHCGGKSGFRTNIYYKAARYTEWDGNAADTDDYSVLRETNPTCMDCDKPVRSLFRAAMSREQSGGDRG